MRKAFSALAVAALTTVGWATVTITPAASATTTGFVVDTGSTNQGKLYSLNLSTGAPTEIGQTGKNDIEGLSLDCSGTLFGVNRRPNQQVDANGTASPNAAVNLNQLVTLNTTTGATTIVGTLSVEPADAGLTFGTDGKLYMAEVNTGEFYEVNKSTAAVTDIGPMGNSVEITALATRADGTIFGYDRNVGQLVTINPATGASTVIGSSAEVNLIGMDFDASGTLWGVSQNGRILTFNPSTGAATDVTTYNNDQNRFVSLAIAPEGCAAPTPPAPTPTPEAPAAEAVAAVAQLTG
jgi:hypothetical protein